MTTLITRERDLYEELWGALPAYGAHSPGADFLPQFHQMTEADPDHTILDAGCGSGATALALRSQGFPALTLCDLTDAGLTPAARDLPFKVACLWQPLAPQLDVRDRFDWTLCCDVLEHLPTALVLVAVRELLQVTRQGLFLSICLLPDNLGVWVGTPLHQTVQPFTWWRDHLAEMGELLEARDCLMTGLFLLRSRP